MKEEMIMKLWGIIFISLIMFFVGIAMVASIWVLNRHTTAIFGGIVVLCIWISVIYSILTEN